MTDILAFADQNEDRVLSLAAAVESDSEHPIAAGILRTAEKREVEVPRAKKFEALTGKGVRAEVEGREVEVLSPRGAADFSLPDHDADTFLSQGKTLAYVIEDGPPIGLLALADTIRPESKEAIAMLHERGIRALMLTGDKKEAADWVASESGSTKSSPRSCPTKRAR